VNREHGALGRIGQALVRKRGVVLAPIFVVAFLRRRPFAAEAALEAVCVAAVLLAWALRMWAMGYRNWVRGPGERHLITRGPYALLRHPRYLANFVAGLAWFALAFDPVLVVVYVLVYGALLGTVIVREEEKLAQDYPGFAEWRARVPALLPALWRLAEVRAREEGEAWRLATIKLEPLKLALVLAGFAALALARRGLVAY
jgi:protein-S-isoprenylcysteine O-methyltransferase Ste14